MVPRAEQGVETQAGDAQGRTYPGSFVGVKGILEMRSGRAGKGLRCPKMLFLCLAASWPQLK